MWIGSCALTNIQILAHTSTRALARTHAHTHAHTRAHAHTHILHRASRAVLFLHPTQPVPDSPQSPPEYNDDDAFYLFLQKHIRSAEVLYATWTPRAFLKSLLGPAPLCCVLSKTSRAHIKLRPTEALRSTRKEEDWGKEKSRGEVEEIS